MMLSLRTTHIVVFSPPPATHRHSTQRQPTLLLPDPTPCSKLRKTKPGVDLGGGLRAILSSRHPAPNEAVASLCQDALDGDSVIDPPSLELFLRLEVNGDKFLTCELYKRATVRCVFALQHSRTFAVPIASPCCHISPCCHLMMRAQLRSLCHISRCRRWLHFRQHYLLRSRQRG